MIDKKSMAIPGGDTGFAIPAWMAWVVCLGFAFLGLGSFAILNNNEGLYAEVPREMLASHDWHIWVIPHLDGLPYMEKPPLLFWLTALSFFLFGQAEWVARIVPAVSALACSLMLMRFGERVGRPQSGRLAAIMFISGLGVTAMSHVLMFDMLLTALLTAALMSAYRVICDGCVRSVRLSYAFLALAVMAKGFVALVLFGLVVFAFLALVSRSLADFAHMAVRWFDPWGVAIFLAIGVPWHVAACMTEPIFGWFYFVNEHFLRFLGKREPHDYYSGPGWYYLPRMAIYLFPWSLLLPSLLMRVKASRDTEPARLKLFLSVAWIAPLIFFSLSSAKANYYLVVVMPFAALHLALVMEERNFLGTLARGVPGLLIAVLAGGLCLAFAVRGIGAQQTVSILGMTEQHFLFAAAAGIGVLAIAAAAVAMRFSRVGVLAYLALPVLSSFVMIAILNAMEPLLSTRTLAQYLQSEQQGRAVHLYRDFETLSSLPFYLKSTVPVVDAHSSDLLWGSRLRINDIFVSPESFASILSSRPVAVVVHDRQLKDFRESAFFRFFKGEKRIGDTTVFLN